MNGRSIAGPVAALVVAMASIQFGASLAKGLFPLIGAAATSGLRLLFAAVILVTLLRPWRQRFERKTWPALIGYGVSLGLMNLLFYLAIARIPLGIGVALEFTGPLVLAVVTSRKAVDFLWIGLAAAGLLVLLPILKIAAPVDPVGAVFALGAGACWALYIVTGQKAGAEHGLSTAAAGMAIAALVAAPIGLASATDAVFAPHVLLLALAVAVLSSALPYTLEMIALPRIPTRTFGVLMSIEPVVAAIFGMIVLGERLATAQWAAIVAIIAASAGAAFTSAKAAPLQD